MFMNRELEKKVAVVAFGSAGIITSGFPVHVHGFYAAAKYALESLRAGSGPQGDKRKAAFFGGGR